MATYDRTCDVYQGFNYRKDKVTPVGFVTSLKVGTADLSSDLTCKDPMDPSTDVTAVVVLSNISWGLGVTDAIYINGQMSSPNREAVKLLTYTDLTDVTVEVNFVVYSYDPVSKKYFKEFHSEDTTLNGLLEKSSGDVALDVADQLSTEVEYPENFSFFVGVKPKAEAQTLTVQVSDTAKVAKQWGLTQT